MRVYNMGLETRAPIGLHGQRPWSGEAVSFITVERPRPHEKR